VPYRFLDGGGAIMVPAGRVHELRMKLAAAGLPSGASGGGYELLDKNSFGQTQGQERMKMQRAIEGELTTTIQALESVKSARVHLALPNQNGFFREQQKPSASVVLTLHGAARWTATRSPASCAWSPAACPRWRPRRSAWSTAPAPCCPARAPTPNASGLDSQQLQFRREIEAGHAKRILSLLEPVVGRDNVRASVTADIDFSQVMQTAEAYRPNQGPDAKAAIREQRTEDATQPGSATPGGVPGATSNQPPVPATAPINGQAQPLQGAPAAAPPAAAPGARPPRASRWTRRPP
jgi:flagellar M-ring protein FliF